MFGNRFDLEEYAKVKSQEMLREVQATRGGRGLGLSLLVAAGAALLVVTALLLTLPPATPGNASDVASAPVVFQWHSPIRSLPEDMLLLISVRDHCVFLGAGDFEKDFTLQLPGVGIRQPASVNACTPEMPVGSRLR